MNSSGPNPENPRVSIRYHHQLIVGRSCTEVIRQLGCLEPGTPIAPYVADVQRRCNQLYGRAPRAKPYQFLKDLAEMREIKIYHITDGRRS